jgi:ubiquitin thioesterase OTU1
LQAEGPQAAAYQAAAEQLVAGCHAARQFTDTATFTLRCSACMLGLKGAKEAQEHAAATGHTNFTEY